MAEKLKEYCTVISGYAFKSKDLSEGTDIPVIKIGNISNGKNVVIDDSTQYVNEEFLSVDEKYHIKNGDILISLTGSHMNQPNSMVGRCCRNLDDTIYLLNQRAGKIIPNKSVDKDFLYYVFRLPSIQYAIANRAYGGANQVNVSPKDVMGIKFDMLAYLDSEMTCNQACCVFSDKNEIISRHYLFHYLYSIRDYLLLIGFGAAQQNLSQDLIKKVKIVIPPTELIKKFDEQKEPLYQTIRALMMQNDKLIKQRDMLLPRLMSGKLEV